jgi:hypothetical protein
MRVVTDGVRCRSVQRKCARLAASLDASQAQARQADSEVQEVAKAFAILQREVSPGPLTLPTSGWEVLVFPMTGTCNLASI